MLANLINVFGDVTNLIVVLKKYKNDGGPSEIEFREQYDRDGTFKDVKLKSGLTCQSISALLQPLSRNSAQDSIQRCY